MNSAAAESSFMGFDVAKSWDYENGFLLTSVPRRLQKMVAHYELYKSITGLPGHVVECGVFKGASLIRFCTFRAMLESEDSRKVIGFDAFGKFPSPESEADQTFVDRFEGAAGNGIDLDELHAVMTHKGFENYELVKGDVHDTIPEYCARHPELRISLLHLDLDVYEPTREALDNLAGRVVRGGLIVLDDYGTVAGETQAVDEYLQEHPALSLQKLPISHIPSFIRI